MSVNRLIPRSSPGNTSPILLRFRLHLFLLPLLISPFLTACGGGSDGDWAGSIALEDGVTHLYNPEIPLWGADHQPLVEKEVLGADGSDIEALFSQPIGLITGRDGTRYVLDAKDMRVLRFDREGSYLGSFGREGEGPGEFSAPVALALLPGEVILIADSGNRRLSRFTTDGRFLDSETLQRGLGQIRVDRSGRVHIHDQSRGMTISIMMGVEDSKEESTLIDILDDAGERVGGFGLVEEYEGFMLSSWMNKVYPAFTPGDSMVMNYMGKDRIEVYTPDGILARVVHRNLPYVPVEPVEETRQTAHDDGTMSFSMFFEFDIQSTGFAVSPDGRYWAALIAVTQTDRREGVEEEDEIPQEWAVDLFDSTGRWLARHPLGIDFPQAGLDWGPAGLYILNPEGDAAVYRYEVVPPGV